MGVDGLDFNAPATRQRIEGLLRRLRIGERSKVLDVGCGRGEMLRMLAEASGCTGVGVDPDEDEVAIARQRVPTRGTLIWHCARIDDVEVDGGFEAAICVGATHAFAAPGEALPQTLLRLADHVVEEGRLLLGEGYWRRDPPAEYLQAAGFGARDLLGHRENEALGERAGLALVHSEVSSLEEWDQFETAFLRNAEARAATAPDDTQALRNLEHWQRWHEAYRRWGRDTLGFGFYVFEKGGNGSHRI